MWRILNRTCAWFANRLGDAMFLLSSKKTQSFLKGQAIRARRVALQINPINFTIELGINSSLLTQIEEGEVELDKETETKIEQFFRKKENQRDPFKIKNKRI